MSISFGSGGVGGFCSGLSDFADLRRGEVARVAGAFAAALLLESFTGTETCSQHIFGCHVTVQNKHHT